MIYLSAFRTKNLCIIPLNNLFHEVLPYYLNELSNIYFRYISYAALSFELQLIYLQLNQYKPHIQLYFQFAIEFSSNQTNKLHLLNSEPLHNGLFSLYIAKTIQCNESFKFWNRSIPIIFDIKTIFFFIVLSIKRYTYII